MTHAFPFAIVIALATSGMALADDNCHSRMAGWQTREAATAYVAGLGISADRLRIDDGCYEVRGQDSDGNRVELKLDPATLAVMEMDITFRPGADLSRYLPDARALSDGPSQAPQGNPALTPDTDPQTGGN